MKISIIKLKWFLLILVLNTLNLNAQTPNTWVTKASISGFFKYDVIAFSIANKGYMGGGTAGSLGLSVDFWEYDPLTDVWAQKANLGGVARTSAVGFSIANKGYFGTGSTFGTTFLNDFWEYDPITNTWTQKANVGGLGRAEAIGFSIGNKGYVGLGASFPASVPDFWEYDPANDSWTQKTNYPAGNRNYAVAFAIGNTGYVGTGQGNNPSNIYAYEPSLNTWTLKNFFPNFDRTNAVGFAIGNLGYIGTGHSPTMSGGDQRDFWEYNPVSNNWTQRAILPGSKRTAAFGFVIGSTGYIGGGMLSSNGGAYNDFYAYTPCLSDVSVIKNGPVLSSNQSGATYQWVSNCAFGNTVTISGATSQSYTTTVDGSYAVVINYGGCVSTSSCITISTIGVEEYRLNAEQKIIIYPNPNNGTVGVKSSMEGVYQLIDILGQTIKTLQLDATNNFTVTIDDLPQGIYTLVRKENNQTVSQKIIVIK